MYLVISKYMKNGDVPPYIFNQPNISDQINYDDSETKKIIEDYELSKTIIGILITSNELKIAANWINTEEFSYQVTIWEDYQDIGNFIEENRQFYDDYVKNRKEILKKFKIDLVHLGIVSVEKVEELTVEYIDSLIKESELLPFPQGL